jgi:hypothetical protein
VQPATTLYALYASGVRIVACSWVGLVCDTPSLCPQRFLVPPPVVLLRVHLVRGCSEVLGHADSSINAIGAKGAVTPSHCSGLGGGGVHENDPLVTHCLMPWTGGAHVLSRVRTCTPTVRCTAPTHPSIYFFRHVCALSPRLSRACVGAAALARVGLCG